MLATQTVSPSIQWWVAEAINDYHSRVFAATAGFGSGKTHGALQWHHDRVALNSKSRFSAVMMPTYQKIFDSIIPNYEKVLHSLGFVKNKNYRILKAPYPKVTYAGSNHEVHFISAERPDKIFAVEYSHGTLDEAGSTKEEAFRFLRSRLRDNDAKARQIMVCGAPQGLNWFADHFDSDNNVGWLKNRERDHDFPEKKYRRFRLTTHDNPYVPSDYVEQLYDIYGHNPNMIKSYIYGYFVPLIEGNCYSNFLPDKHVINDIAADQYRDILLTWDFNANPLAWIAMQRITFEEYGGRTQRYVALKESSADTCQLDDAVVDFAKQFPPEKFRHTWIRLYGDSSGHAASHKVKYSDYEAVYHYLKELGYQRVEICAMRHNPVQTESVDALNRWFLNDEHYVCKCCIQYRKSLTATRWKQGTKTIEKPAGETWTHHSDAGKYLAYRINEGKVNRVSGTNLV